MNAAASLLLETSHPVIESVEVDGGYLSGLRMKFASGLNAIVGEKGAGKSTFIELVRYALDAYILPSLRAQHLEQVEACLGAGTVTVVIRMRNGIAYRISRSFGQPPVITDENDKPVHVRLDSGLFTARILAQSEIPLTAQNREALLRLLDTFLEAGGRPLFDEIEAVLRRLAVNAEEIQRVWREIADDDHLARELSTLRVALDAFAAGDTDDALHAEAKRLYQSRARRARERSALALVFRETADADAALDVATNDLERRALTASDTLAGLAAGGASASFLELAAALRTLGDDGADALRAARARARATTERATEIARAVEAEHAGEDAEFASFIREHPEEETRAAERSRVEYRAAEAELAAQRVAAKRREERRLKAKRRLLLERLFELRAELHRQRAQAAERLNAALAGELVISLVESGNLDAYEGVLTEAFRSTNTRKDVIRDLAAYLRPETLAAAIMEDRPGELEAIDDSKEGPAGRAARARRLLDFLQKSGRVFDIETARVDDALEVHIDHKGTRKRASKVSFGQRSSSVLPWLFRGAEGPLVIDQPEDSLSKIYLHDVIVPGVRAAQSKQQLIFVTHEPNIPALGGRGKMFLFESTGSHSDVTEIAREEETLTIERHCEGHEEAIVERAEAYGYEIKRKH